MVGKKPPLWTTHHQLLWRDRLCPYKGEACTWGYCLYVSVAEPWEANTGHIFSGGPEIPCKFGWLTYEETFVVWRYRYCRVRDLEVGAVTWDHTGDWRITHRYLVHILSNSRTPNASVSAVRISSSSSLHLNFQPNAWNHALGRGLGGGRARQS